jgi:hypothetical protein
MASTDHAELASSTFDDSARRFAPEPKPREFSADSAIKPPASHEQARCAARSLEVFGVCAGWALTAVGILAAVRVVADYAAGTHSSLAGWTAAVAHAASWFLVCALLGWGLNALARFGAAAVDLAIEFVLAASDRVRDEGERIIQAVAALAKALESSNPQQPTTQSTEPARAPAAITEIERAIAQRQWSSAESLIAQLEASAPGDAAVTVIKERYESARARVKSEQLGQLDAARHVNDPDTVLSIFQSLGSVLDDSARTALERDLAKWFLSLIRRRLSAGKLQPEVVRLAERVADVFAGTVEGASVRASLPTLRRSVGLCPRCAAPYAGIGDACPACLAGRPQNTPRGDSNGETQHSTPTDEDDPLESDLNL